MEERETVQLFLGVLQEAIGLPCNKVSEGRGRLRVIRCEAASTADQLLFEVGEKIPLTAASEDALALVDGQLDGFLGAHAVVVDEPGADDEEGPAPAGVAVHCHLLVLADGAGEDVHDAHHMLEGGRSHVFPALAEARDSVGVETLWQVTKPSLRDDSVPTVRVLHLVSSTSPGSCRFMIAPIPTSLNLLYSLNSFMSRSEGRCMARMSSVIQLECSPSIALGCFLFLR